jgi:precorrin-2 dehydrogenase/sirohydrochlorin ferrochelatase
MAYEGALKRRLSRSLGEHVVAMKSATKMFALFLKLQHRQCLVVGAGSIAESKIAGLVDAGARVRVVAPDATAKVHAWARARKIDWQRRAFQPADLDGMFLVVAATSSPPLHEQIFSEAQRLGVLCNVVDVPGLCDFYYPAVVQRGALQIAISTAGQSPALAQRLRKELEQQFSPGYERWLEQVGKARRKIHTEKKLNAAERKQLLHALVSPEAFETFDKQAKNSRKEARKGQGRNAKP